MKALSKELKLKCLNWMLSNIDNIPIDIYNTEPTMIYGLCNLMEQWLEDHNYQTGDILSEYLHIYIPEFLRPEECGRTYWWTLNIQKGRQLRKDYIKSLIKEIEN